MLSFFNLNFHTPASSLVNRNVGNIFAENDFFTTKSFPIELAMSVNVIGYSVGHLMLILVQIFLT